jgi:hypothetical protein
MTSKIGWDDQELVAFAMATPIINPKAHEDVREELARRGYDCSTLPRINPDTTSS